MGNWPWVPFCFEMCGRGVAREKQPGEANSAKQEFPTQLYREI